jgi:DNA-binding response OmpR family regulator
MRILLAEDDEVSCLALETLLTRRGYEVGTVADGDEAWRVLTGEDPPRLAILDWMMPGLDGIEICRRVRATARLKDMYVILLTARDSREHIVAGLRAGASDYVTKPFHMDELEARLNIGAQLLQTQAELAQRVQQLEAALAKVKQLEGLLPICSYCKKIRDEKNYWQQVETYLAVHLDARCSHGICPECWDKVVTVELRRSGLTLPDRQS